MKSISNDPKFKSQSNPLFRMFRLPALIFCLYTMYICVEHCKWGRCSVWGHIINPLARDNLKTWSTMAGNLDHLNKLSSFYLLLTRYFGTSLQEMGVIEMRWSGDSNLFHCLYRNIFSMRDMKTNDCGL